VSRLLRDLDRLRTALARRRGAAALLGALAASLALFGAAALAGRAGLFGRAGWVPLAVWIAALGVMGAALRRALAAWRAPAAALRQTAELVEREQALRRGAFVGVVDAAAGAPAGTSAALVESAVRRLVERLPAAGSASWAPAALRSLGALVGRRAAACAIAAGGAALALGFAGAAAAPLASPLGSLRRSLGARVEIAVSPRVVRRGGTVTVLARSSVPGEIRLHVRETGEPWHEVRAASAPGGASARLTGVTALTYVFATAGRAASDTVRVGVLEPAFLTDFTVTARYPAYLDRPDEALPADSSTVLLPVGTVLVLRGAASASLSAAALTAGAERVPLVASGQAFHGELVVRGSAQWRLALADGSGAPIPEPLPLLDVRAVPDSAPVVSVPVPGADTSAPLDLKLPLVVDARDDHALGRVEVVSWRVSRLGTVGERTVDTVPGAAGADHTVQSLRLDLNGRGLLPGDTLRFFARAADRAPQPHVGVSREFVVRLRTLAELREAVRAGVDSLAARASDLAGDQAALSRRTGDLAAQRNRSADSTPGAERAAAERAAAAAESPRAEPPQARSGALPFEQAQEAGRVREAQQRLMERADSLRRELAQVAGAAEAAGLNDPAWQQRLRELDSLLRQAITPDMAARLEELRQALARLDPRAVEQALRNLAESQRELRSQLERSAELFERAALEGSLQTYAQNADALRRAEQQWAERAPERRGGDTAAAAAEQRTLRRQADTLQSGLGALSPRLRQRADTATAAAVERAAEQVAQAAEQMQAAAGAMSAARQDAARQRAQEASRTLQPVGDSLRRSQEQLSGAWRAQVLKLLHDAEAETVTLAVEEQGVADRLRRGEGSGDVAGRQSALEQGVDQIARRLAQAAGRNALVSPRLGAALGRARAQLEQSRRALEGPRADPGEAGAGAQAAAQSLSAAAFQIMQSGEEVAGSQSGSGMAEALRKLAEMAGRQGGLNDQLGGLLPMFGQGAPGEMVLQQLRDIAARQRALANELERLGGMGLPGRPEQLAPEARRLADQLEMGRLDRATLERQQQLFRRMLDAGRTLRNDQESDPERRSETARQQPGRLPAGSVPGEAALRYPMPTWEQLKALAPAERAMVLDYFKRINGQDR
jgi:hypothetical protein